jgi:hypothetical protein
MTITVTVGADPEFFVKRNGHWISGHGFKCGTKVNPMETKHGFIQVDGVALECNVRPAKNKLEFVTNVKGVIDDLREFVHKEDKQCEIIPKNAVFFGKQKLEALPFEARALGCEPDYNAYERKLNDIPSGTVASHVRTGAGHIHIGWTENANIRNPVHMGHCFGIVKELDYYLGLPSLLWEPDPLRRRLYGKAGAFRPKSYGLEYRVLGNPWCASPKHTGFVFDKAVKATKEYFQGHSLFLEFGNTAKDAINSNDRFNWRNERPKLADLLLEGLT